MYVVIVDFVVRPERATAFAEAVRANARASLDREPACHQFDVCVAPDNPARFFLYELYSDRAGFDAHLASEHYQAFDRLVAPWTLEKKPQTFQRIEPA